MAAEKAHYVSAAASDGEGDEEQEQVVFGDCAACPAALPTEDSNVRKQCLRKAIHMVLKSKLAFLRQLVWDLRGCMFLLVLNANTKNM